MRFRFLLAIVLAAGLGLVGLTRLQDAGSATAGAGYVLVGAGHSATAPGEAESRDGGTHTFGITGDVSGLYPGFRTQLVLTISNVDQFAISVQTLSVAVGDASRGCAAANLTVGAYTGGSFTVAGHGSARVALDVQMLHSAPDACEAVAFPLTYSGTAVKAPRPRDRR